MNEHFYAVILAGGGGTRLWPKSRKKTPKHLLKLYGKRTMVQQTYDRIKPLIPKERIYLITLENYVKDIKEQLPGLLEENIIAEPMSKNTALAMGLASTVIRKIDPMAVVVNLAADQLIEDEEAFCNTIELALGVAAADNHLVSIGIKPTFAHTGLGYIKTGQALKDYSTAKHFVYKCDGFKEKPDIETAQTFLNSGKYLWNANLYCWSVEALANAIAKHAPGLNRGLEQIFQSLDTKESKGVTQKVYEDAENVQIDVAVSERVNNLVVIPGDFGWNDVGDWKVIYDTKKKDENGNVVDGVEDLLVNINSEECLIQGNQKLIAVIGLKDIIVVDTKDAILICHKDKTQDVKKVIEKLKEEKMEEYL
ncbi:MAG: sugar phosphate nucleotidyltransferase [Candidatus Daviesbacteria bacterium]|nr:sugar phosphate nucleotidyltransferase [Candidatus Daviesbacteria bacterium]